MFSFGHCPPRSRGRQHCKPKKLRALSQHCVKPNISGFDSVVLSEKCDEPTPLLLAPTRWLLRCQTHGASAKAMDRSRVAPQPRKKQFIVAAVLQCPCSWVAARGVAIAGTHRKGARVSGERQEVEALLLEKNGFLVPWAGAQLHVQPCRI